MIKVGIKNIGNKNIPEYKTSGSSGLDVRADFSRVESENDLVSYEDVTFIIDYTEKKKFIVMEPGSRVLIPTGFIFEIPKCEDEGYKYECQIRSRSGLALKKGLQVTNGIGTVDQDYRDEVKVILSNTGLDPITIEDGERIAQFVFMKVEEVDFYKIESITQTERTGGFGHTGIK